MPKKQPQARKRTAGARSKPAKRTATRTVTAKAKVKPKRATPPPGASTLTMAPPDTALVFNLATGPIHQVDPATLTWFPRAALRWNYVLRNRERWTTDLEVVARHEREMRDVASELGLGPDLCSRIAEAGVVEVDMPWTVEEEHWELRIFPWEFLLAAATRGYRNGRPLAVVRRLRANGVAASAPPHSWLHVVSEPGPLDGLYDFTSEEELLKLTVGSLHGTVDVLRNPDRGALHKQLTTKPPGVIHISGFDLHHAGTLLIGSRASEELTRLSMGVFDGYLIRPPKLSESREPSSRHPQFDLLDAQQVGEVLVPNPAVAPSLVVFNLYHSAARMAPLTVAAGAATAIGFQDAFDDTLAELFFTTFYRAWHSSGWDLVGAFQFAWSTVRNSGADLRGSGLVLWSRQSIVGTATPATTQDSADARVRIHSALEQGLREIRLDLLHEELAVDVQVVPQLNYSLLHNNGSVFERFRIRKLDTLIGAVEGLEVHVNLHVGTDSYPFRMRTAIGKTETHVDLPDRIRLSLASSLSRALRESIHTSLLVEVSLGQTRIYQETHRVTLLPIDEWRFDPTLDHWLPSFVLPRDPAVLRVVDSAQRYLMSLRDDATAGFDGYQCVDPASPDRPDLEECVDVDMQVRALWSALLYENPLSYINPPPVFTGSSQRLRTPSDCLEGRRGTCIDLALLLASCLEYVEIYPAIILLKTHAFPAYWRHEAFHTAFRNADFVPAGDEASAGSLPPSSSAGQTYRWKFGRDQYREIMRAVQNGWLVPLETTLVTGQGSFADAIAEGRENLASRREFESMLDIVYARTDDRSSVTPLPIRRAEA